MVCSALRTTDVLVVLCCCHLSFRAVALDHVCGVADCARADPACHPHDYHPHDWAQHRGGAEAGGQCDGWVCRAGDPCAGRGVACLVRCGVRVGRWMGTEVRRAASRVVQAGQMHVQHGVRTAHSHVRVVVGMGRAGRSHVAWVVDIVLVVGGARSGRSPAAQTRTAGHLCVSTSELGMIA